MATSPTLGRTFDNLLGGRFRVVQTIADDPHGQTYLVEDTIAAEMPRWVAKSFCLINKTNLQLDWARSLFRQEIPKLQQLSDRSTDFPKITAYFEQEGEFYIVEESIDGTRLSDELRTGKSYTELEVIQFLKQLLTTLHTAHSTGMVHGDITPHNLIHRQGQQGQRHQFVLTNFAILKGVYATAARNGVILGTPSYMPFEQALGKFTPSCDIYSLGLTAIQLLTGLHPSQLVRRGDLNLLDWQIAYAVRPELIQILNRMVKHHPEERYQNVQDVLYDLDNSLSDLPDPNVDNFPLSKMTMANVSPQFSKWAIAIACIGAIGWGISNTQVLSPSNWLGSLTQPTPTAIPTPDSNVYAKYRMRLNLTGHTGWVRAVAFFPNGFSLASGSYDRTVRLWNVSNNKSFGTLSNHLGSISGINAIAVHPNGNTFAIACIDKTIKLWNFRSGKPIRNLEGHDGQVYGVAYSPDGKTLVSASADKTIKLWNWNRGEVLQTFTGHQDKVVAVIFHRDGKRIASASADKTIRIWDVATAKELIKITGHNSPVNAIAFSPDGKLLASGSQDQTIKIWDVSNGKLLKTLSGHTGGVLAVAFNRDGQAIASGGIDQTIRIWDVDLGKSVQTIDNHEAPILSLSFSPKDNTLVSGSADRSVKVWQ